jgi:Leucine-rich repeat (LRR) protein
MAKPKIILDIEKVYRIKLQEAENVLNSYPSYSLNEHNEVSGLNLSSQKIKELQPLTQFTCLTELVLADNQIVDISPISELKFIYLLNLSNNKISDISPVKTLQKLLI